MDSSQGKLRKIIHLDMDAFFASVEQRDFPELRGKPIAVGGGGKRGVTTTASYEARKYGVKSAMPGYLARKLCPQIIFVKPRFEVYAEVSRKIRSIFSRYTDLIEPLSLDEAFLDVTKNKKNYSNATSLAKAIISDVKTETSLTCSAGVSFNKFLAKVASGLHKPNAITVIRPEQAVRFLKSLPITDFFGVGKVTALKMKSLGIHSGADLLNWSKIDLAKEFGKSGLFYYNIVRGIDDRPVIANQIRKSIAVERTFSDDLTDENRILHELKKILDLLFERLYRNENFGRTLTLKVKLADFTIQTRSRTVQHYVFDKMELENMTMELYQKHFSKLSGVRLLGLAASKLSSEEMSYSAHQLQFKF